MAQLVETLRRAVGAADESRYRIAKESGVNASQLSRLVSGERGLSIESAERLADYLGYELVMRPKSRTRRAK